MKITSKTIAAFLLPALILCGCGKHYAILESDESSVNLTEEIQAQKATKESQEVAVKKIPKLIEKDIDLDYAVSDEHEAESLLKSHLLIEDDTVSFRYSGRDSNDFETWYDFVEFYGDYPIWGCSSRIHVYPYGRTSIQGRAVVSGFETDFVEMGEKQAFQYYFSNTDEANENYVCVETCYLYIAGNNVIPLCYHYSNGLYDVFLSVSTGELVSEKQNFIID